MPGGLRDVEQRFGADATGYLAEISKIIAANREVLESIREVQKVRVDLDNSGALAKIGEVRAALGGLGDKTVKLDLDTSGAMAKVAALKAALGDLGSAGGIGAALGGGGDSAAMIRELRDISASMDMATTSLGNMESHLTSIRRDVADSSADLMMQTQVLRDNADAHNAAATAVSALAAARARGGGGGGGTALVAAAGAAAGGGIGAAIFGGAAPTLAAAHMVTMLTMEVASQVIPAAVAAGAAAAVGYQGGAAAFQRGTGIYNAGEALGGAYGVTPGQLFGLGSGFQVAQNQATGGVYGIIGSLMRMAGGGTGQGGILGPGGMGVQTVAMIDRGLANMVGSGRMSQLSTALGGGTGALRTIGDIGANIGDTLLNLAPNLPGMGNILFGGLKGITGAASWLTGNTPGPLLGAGLAAEAGFRWGGPILGGGKLPWFLGGRQFGGLAGLAERMGLGTVGGAGADAAGLAGFLGGGAAGPVGLAAALSAFTMSQLASTMPTSGMRQIAGLQAGINQSFGAGSLDPITKALYQAGQMTTGAPPTGFAASMAQNIPAMETSSQIARFGPQGGMGAPPAAVIQNAVTSFAQQLGQMVASGPAAQKALNDLGVKGATLTQAMDYMTMAMISPKDVGPGGKLDPTALSQLAGFVKTYSLMRSGGQTNASAILSASSADYIMATPQMKSLSQINSALDSMTSIMTGGTANASALFQAGAAAPRNMARALGQGPFTTAGAAAWQAFTNPQTGIMAASQANMDQLRTFMTIGGLSGAQAGQLGAFELKQSVMPFASQSPMALAMLQQQAMQAGVPGVAMGQSFAATQKAINAHAGNMQQANQLLTQGTQAAANIPGVANFLNPNANISPLQSALYAQMAQSALAAVRHPTGANVAALQSSVSMSGVKPGQMTVAVDAILKNLHVPSNLIAEINGKLKMPPVPPAKGVVNFDNFLKPVPQQHASGVVHYVNQLTRPSVPTLSGTIVYHAVISTAANISGAGNIGAIGGHTGSGMQRGFKVPGYGGGDIFPAMLEPGELVVPKHMTPWLQPFLGGKIPGFAGGGMIGGGGGSGASDWVLAPLPLPAAAQKIIDAFEKTFHGMGSPWGKLASEILSGLLDGIKNAKGETAKMAQALVSKVTQEVNYAKGVSSATVQGLNLAGMTVPAPGSQIQMIQPGPGARGFNAASYNAYVQAYAADSLPGGLNAAAQPQSVQQQMQSYLKSIQAFQKDIGTLSKDHLNKDVLKQLISAGPVQGDALAQSILGGKGGVGAVNQMYKQIQQASNQLGIQAAQAIYGPIQHGKPVAVKTAADLTGVHQVQAALGSLHNKTVVIKVQVDMGSAHGLADLNIKTITEQVQAALLKQARRNQRTGIQLSGRGA